MPLLTTSWDDGTPTDVDLGRLLARHGLRATFYVTTGPGGSRTIDDPGLEELVSLGHELGNHGRTHRPFTELTTRELQDEVEWGERETARFGPAAQVVAPPRGRVDGRVVRTLRAGGLAVRAAPVLGGRGVPCDLMPTAQVYPHSRARTAAHLLRRRTAPPAGNTLAWGVHRDLWARLRALARRAASAERDLHLWGHSEELERLALYDGFEQLLTELLALGFEPVTNGELVARSGAR